MVKAEANGTLVVITENTKCLTLPICFIMNSAAQKTPMWKRKCSIEILNSQL